MINLNDFIGTNLMYGIGVVEDAATDPLQSGRIKVRFFGIHPEEKDLVPTEDLPWAIPILSPLFQQSGGRGTGAHFLPGTWVFGFFIDGRDAQHPFILGAIPNMGMNTSFDPCGGSSSGSNNPVGNQPGQGTQPDGVSDTGPIDRSRFNSELSNPDVRNRLAGLTAAEVGGGADKSLSQTAFMETVMNRATYRGTSLSAQMGSNYYASLNDGGYNRAVSSMTTEESSRLNNIMNNVQGGTNVSNYALHNASGAVAANAYRKGFVGKTYPDSGETMGYKTGGPGDPNETDVKSKIPLKQEENPSNTPPAQDNQGFKDPAQQGPNDQSYANDEKPTQILDDVKNQECFDLAHGMNGGKFRESDPHRFGAYPATQALVTDSGHMLAFDDTAGQETVTLSHRDGSSIEMGPSGVMKIKGHNDVQIVMDRNGTIAVNGRLNMSVKGSGNIFLGHEADIQIGGDGRITFGNDVNINVAGNANINVGEMAQIKADSIKLESTGKIDIVSAKGINMTSEEDINIRGKNINWYSSEKSSIISKDNMNIKVTGTYDLTSSGSMDVKVGGAFTSKADSHYNAHGSEMHLQEGIAATEATPTEAEVGVATGMGRGGIVGSGAGGAPGRIHTGQEEVFPNAQSGGGGQFGSKRSDSNSGSDQSPASRFTDTSGTTSCDDLHIPLEDIKGKKVTSHMVKT